MADDRQTAYHKVHQIVKTNMYNRGFYVPKPVEECQKHLFHLSKRAGVLFPVAPF